jgi:hypothetical protein
MASIAADALPALALFAPAFTPSTFQRAPSPLLAASACLQKPVQFAGLLRALWRHC